MPLGTLTVAVSVVAVTTIEEATAVTLKEGPENLTLAPASKPVPLKVTVSEAPTATAWGLALVSVGAGVMGRQPVQVTEPLVSDTVTSRVRWPRPDHIGLDRHSLGATLIRVGVTPLPEMVTFSGETNPLPSIATSAAAPSASWPGVTEEMVMGARGITALEAADEGPVPAELVAVTPTCSCPRWSGRSR